MKAFNLIAILFVLLPLQALSATFTGKVVGVMDGDTIKVMHQGKPEKIRLHGIDSPEKGQAFGKRAKKFTSKLCFGKTVEVLDLDRDQYGRTIAEVFLPDGRSLNREIVRNGMGWWYRKYAAGDAVLEALESQAKDKKIGLWAGDEPVPPWKYRWKNKGKVAR